MNDPVLNRKMLRNSMNDPVLNRKMFRHAAQIKHNRIPKYQTGTPPEGLRIPGADFSKKKFYERCNVVIRRRKN